MSYSILSSEENISWEIEKFLNDRNKEIFFKANDLRKQLKNEIQLSYQKELNNKNPLGNLRKKKERLEKLKGFVNICNIEINSNTKLTKFLNLFQEAQATSFNRVLDAKSENHQFLLRINHKLKSSQEQILCSMKNIFHHHIALLKEYEDTQEFAARHKISEDVLPLLQDAHTYHAKKIVINKNLLHEGLQNLSSNENLDFSSQNIGNYIQNFDDNLQKAMDKLALDCVIKLKDNAQLNTEVVELVNKKKVNFLLNELNRLQFYFIKNDLESDEYHEQNTKNEKFIYLLHALFLREFIDNLVFEQKEFFWKFLLNIKFCDDYKKLQPTLRSNQETWYKQAYDNIDIANDALFIESLCKNLTCVSLDADLFDDILSVKKNYENKMNNEAKTSYKQEMCKSWLVHFDILVSAFLQKINLGEKILLKLESEPEYVPQLNEKEIVDAIGLIKTTLLLKLKEDKEDKDIEDKKDKKIGIAYCKSSQLSPEENVLSRLDSPLVPKNKVHNFWPSFGKGIVLGMGGLTFFIGIATIVFFSGGAAGIFIGSVFALALKTFGVAGLLSVSFGGSGAIGAVAKIIANKFSAKKDSNINHTSNMKNTREEHSINKIQNPTTETTTIMTQTLAKTELDNQAQLGANFSNITAYETKQDISLPNEKKVNDAKLNADKMGIACINSRMYKRPYHPISNIGIRQHPAYLECRKQSSPVSRKFK